MLKDYIYDNKFQLLVIDNMIDLLNYIDIISFSDTNIIVKCPNYTISIKGSNLTITKMIDTELVINGNINDIEFR